MNRMCKTASLVAFLALLTTASAFTQTPSTEATPEAKAAPPVAYVYIQTTKGVNVYDATAAGKLTLVKGSPFSTSGQMEGINGKYLISVGTDYLHAYAIEPNGVIGKQVSEINTQDYAGAECGTTSALFPNGSVLDHTGKYLYVQLFASAGDWNYPCVAWQSYRILPDGSFTFLGSIDYSDEVEGANNPSTVPTISSNNNFAFGAFESVFPTKFSAFSKASNGVLFATEHFTETGPEGDPVGNWIFFPLLTAADPASHLAAVVQSQNSSFSGFYGPLQLASYTIDGTTGGIQSTNTWTDMPVLSMIHVGGMSTSPSGKLLAVAGYPGLQIFHFNGAAPITTYSSLLLPAVDMDQLAWDNDNHLFVLSYGSGEFYVYTATPTSIKEVSGSPYKIDNAYGIQGLIVVPKL